MTKAGYSLSTSRRCFRSVAMGGTRQVAIAVEDDIFPDNGGIWSFGPNGTERSSVKPEAYVKITELTALLFGAQQASLLAASGSIKTTSAEVAGDLDRVFATSLQPHSSISF
ncbi:sterol carrier protein domain-containing protein [Phyllobacterium sp. SB3]|uniref:sterol carrier protein domain-containing protein n=1 Tax=Phyllobacterium sp. SB3 TaxID=3156073 RepID=UPI0032AE8EF0